MGLRDISVVCNSCNWPSREFDVLLDELIQKLVAIELRYALRSWIVLHKPAVYCWGEYGGKVNIGVSLCRLPNKFVGNGFAGNIGVGRGVVLGVNVINIGSGVVIINCLIHYVAEVGFKESSNGSCEHKALY